jgi:hypothetical protein
MKMMRPRTTDYGVPVVTAVLVLLLGGCNQSLCVQVKLIDFPPKEGTDAAWIQECTEVHEKVKQAIARRAPDTEEAILYRLVVITFWSEQAADLIRSTCCENLAIGAPGVECSTEEFQEGYERFYNDWEALNELRERARGLLEQYGKLHPSLFRERAAFLLSEADTIANQISYLTSSDPGKAIEAFEKRRADKGDIALMRQMGESVFQFPIAFTVRQGDLAFGGFVQPTIYEINPGSEAFRYITRCKPIGDAFSCVDIDAAGKSTAMIVQESPGQFRLREVSNDPSILLQNAVFITDMTLRAAAQYAGLP